MWWFTSLSRDLLHLFIIFFFAGAAATICNSPVSDVADLASCSVVTLSFNDYGYTDTSVVADCLTYASAHINIDGGDFSSACFFSDICHNNDALTMISFQRLTFVEGNIFIANSHGHNTALTFVDLQSLSFVGGVFEIAQNTAITSLSLHSLTFVGQNVLVTSNNAITTLNLPVLTFVGHLFSVGPNPELASISAPALVKIANLDGNYWAVAICNNVASVSYSAAITQAAAGNHCFIQPDFCATATTCA